MILSGRRGVRGIVGGGGNEGFWGWGSGEWGFVGGGVEGMVEMWGF